LSTERIAIVAALLALAACASPSSDKAAGVAAPAAAVPTQAAAQPLPPLKGTRWRGIINPAFDQSHVPWLEFVTDGRISGYTGCNMLSGEWRTESGKVEVGRLVTTKRACAGPESEVERQFLAAFGGQSQVSREGAKLVVTNPADGRRFEFYKAD
jgi:heat shock protein HslJ